MKHDGKIALVGLAALAFILAGNFFTRERKLRRCRVWFGREGFARIGSSAGPRISPEEIAAECQGEKVVVVFAGDAVSGAVDDFVDELVSMGLDVSFGPAE